MGVPKSRGDQKYQRIKCPEHDDPTTNRYQYVESIALRQRAEKIIDEIHQELDPERFISGLRNVWRARLGFDENWKRENWDQDVTLACLKIELEKRFFGHGAYRNKKNNLNHQMMHEARHMDAERCFLKMFNSKKHKESGSPLNEFEEQGKLSKFHRVSVLSKKELQQQIQVLEKKREEDMKLILDTRKMLETIKREITRARPCSQVVWGICKHPKVYEFDPSLWGLCRCTCRKPLSKKDREATIANMKLKSLREKLESIRGQRRRVFYDFLDQMNSIL